MKQLNQWQVHWAEQLTDYEFQIHYKKGNENDDADALSRCSDHKGVKTIHTEILHKDEEETLTKGLAAMYKVKNTFLTDKELIKICHDSRTGRHLEVKCMKNLIQRRCNIKDLRNWITEYIARCDSCWRNKIQRDKRYDEIARLNALNASWESVTMNFITKLLLSKDLAWEVKFDSILTIVNWLTKYTMFIPFRETATAPVLTYTILRELVSNHELSKEFIIDRNKLFTSKFWEMLTAELRIKHKMLTAYHPQTDEQSKQMNQTVKTYLRHYVNAKQDNWVWLLPMAQFVYNSARSETTEKTPFLANYEYHLKVWWDSWKHRSKSQKVILDIADMRKLHANLTTKIQQQKEQKTDAELFKVKEKVYLRTDNI